MAADTMTHLGSAMVVKQPTPEQQATLEDVLEIARAWKGGTLPLAGVRTACTGHDRNTAMRCAGLGTPEKYLVMELVDALVADADRREGTAQTKHGYIGQEEKHIPGRVDMRDWRGKTVWVWPMFWMNEKPYYPRVDLEPGEERTRIEEAMLATYREYRKGKRPQASERRYGGA